MVRRRRQDISPGQDRWVLSYADFITLLFAFFTTLYAMSATDARKAEQLAQSLRESFGNGVLEAGAMPRPEELHALAPAAEPSTKRQMLGTGRRLDVLGERARAIAEEAARPEGVKVRRTEEGLVISLADTFFFDSGGARLSADAAQTLKRIAGLLGPIPNHVRVEGHTDSVQVATQRHPSNWHLSVLRAVEVLGIFEREGIPPYRLSASGFADQRPLVSNATLAGRRMNRRVDIVVLRAHIRGADA